MSYPFSISQVSSREDRIPLSSKVRTYFEAFVLDRVLTPHHLIIGGKWRVILGIIFMSSSR